MNWLASDFSSLSLKWGFVHHFGKYKLTVWWKSLDSFNLFPSLPPSLYPVIHSFIHSSYHISCNYPVDTLVCFYFPFSFPICFPFCSLLLELFIFTHKVDLRKRIFSIFLLTGRSLCICSSHIMYMQVVEDKLRQRPWKLLRCLLQFHTDWGFGLFSLGITSFFSFLNMEVWPLSYLDFLGSICSSLKCLQ